MTDLFIRCRCAHFREGYSSPKTAFEYIDDAIVVIRDGTFCDIVPASQSKQLGISNNIIVDKRPALMLPGLIDAHVHSPQLQVIASYGEQLLEWLEKYTFPAELECAQQPYSEKTSTEFIEALLANGTTSAFIFTTSFKHNTQHLFDAALKKNMRIVAGKVLMDRNAPAALLDGKSGINDSRELILKYHEKKRLGYAITPRFSATSTNQQLSSAGKLLAEIPSLWMQTHLSENKAEIAWTKSLFPTASDYLNTYEMHGLHTSKSLYAHCVHLSESETQRIAEAGCTVAFCPSSNLFLGSGLLDLNALKNAGVDYALASDVGAGTSLSMLKTMGDAYKVAQLQGYPLSPLDAFYSATLGAAKTLHLNRFIGSLEAGKEADYILLDSRLNPHISKRLDGGNSIEEELFVYMIMGDERIICETGVAGEVVYSNPSLGKI